MRSMADSRAAYMASVKLVSSTFWLVCCRAVPAPRRGTWTNDAPKASPRGSQPALCRSAKSRPDRSETNGAPAVVRWTRSALTAVPTRTAFDVVLGPRRTRP